MNAIYITILTAFFISGIAAISIYLSLKSGQFEDIEAAKYRIFFDDTDSGNKK